MQQSPLLYLILIYSMVSNIFKLLMKFSPTYCYFILLRAKYSPCSQTLSLLRNFAVFWYGVSDYQLLDRTSCLLLQSRTGR
jgi:hypothetical protein